MKSLPIAKTEIKEIIGGNFLYVDKTKFIKQLVDDRHTYYFLSRPRRFGKSLFVDTLRAAFAGEKELFNGLYLENNWDWNVQYPVISISFGGGTQFTTEQLNNHINFLLKNNARKYGIELSEIEIPDRFAELIQLLSEKFNLPVVILIDEYDKPILDNLTKPAAEVMREGLSSFYSVLKDASKYLKFVFLTGVSKFSKTSIFSKLNNLTDISLVEKYADICGITQIDLETIFTDYLIDVDLKKIQRWYDGYNFKGDDLYNPYNVLMFLWEKRYKPYWFQTGTPTFLMELIKKRQFFIPELEKLSIAENQLEEFNIDNIDLNVLLFQTGYLTIQEEYVIGEHTYYNLKIPNTEVKIGLSDYLLNMFYASGSDTNARTALYKQVYFSITQGKPQDLEPAFKSFFSSIPFEWYKNNNIQHFEGFYSSLFYAFFAAQGFTILPEDFTNRGRMDMSIVTDNTIYIFEFKMKTNVKNALQQIKDMKYYEKYLSANKKIFLIGIEFDEEQKNISVFECEKL
jgi:hypothetical protein